MKQTTEAKNGSSCHCAKPSHQTKFVVVTGGPGAGKTAVLELVRKVLCPHVSILPEAASILFGGGFWRRDSIPGRAAAQRAIFHIQKELERIVIEEDNAALALCDRGSIDGLAYWPYDEATYWKELNTTREAEFARYAAVIHLKTPTKGNGYNQRNPVRIESPEEAQAIDAKLLSVWEGHPSRVVIESHQRFLQKADQAIEAMKKLIPECCRMELG